MVGMFDLSVLLLGSAIIMVPSILVFIDAMTRPSPWRTAAVYLIMFLTGAVVALFDISYRVAVPYFYHGQTLGMRFFRSRMLKEDGTEVPLKSLLVRAIVSFFSVVFTLGLYYFVEAIAFLASVNHHSFTDTVSQTIVVDSDDEN
jgi:uncharacterized RDD family membrane protein YckC